MDDSGYCCLLILESVGRAGTIFVATPIIMDLHNTIPYSRKIWRFGSLYYNHQIKIRQNFLLAYIRMAIPYQTAKFKSANILAIAILGSTAKFNSRQYFRLYSITIGINYFRGWENFVTAKSTTKITKISTTRKLSAI